MFFDWFPYAMDICRLTSNGLCYAKSKVYYYVTYSRNVTEKNQFNQLTHNNNNNFFLCWLYKAIDF